MNEEISQALLKCIVSLTDNEGGRSAEIRLMALAKALTRLGESLDGLLHSIMVLTDAASARFEQLSHTSQPAREVLKGTPSDPPQTEICASPVIQCGSGDNPDRLPKTEPAANTQTTAALFWLVEAANSFSQLLSTEKSQSGEGIADRLVVPLNVVLQKMMENCPDMSCVDLRASQENTGLKICLPAPDMSAQKSAMEALAVYVSTQWALTIIQSIDSVAKALEKLGKIPVPFWVQLWAQYAEYIISDRSNISDSAKASWDYAKREAGDALATVGIRTDLGHKDVSEVRKWPRWANILHGGPGEIIRQAQSNGVVHGNNIQPDIPGEEPEQYAQSVRRHGESDNFSLTKADSAREGWEALKTLLAHYLIGEGTTMLQQAMREVIETWVTHSTPAPDRLRLPGWPHTTSGVLHNLSSPQMLNALIQSVSRQSTTPGWAPPQAPLQSSGATLQQETNIHIHGVSDPRAAGKEVVERQEKVNSRTVQELSRRTN